DLTTLLLAFFILLFAISSLNLEKFKFAIQSVQVSLGESNPSINLLDIIEVSQLPETVVLSDLTGLVSRDSEMVEDIDEFIKEKKLSEHIILSMANNKIMIRIHGAVLFNSGSAILNIKAKPILNKISKIIANYSEYSVNIKGHTDNLPIVTDEFPSNWELSSIRATNVLKYLINKGINPIRLTATGYGDLLPLSPNNTKENRANNRRVEFVLEKKKGTF
ncbi:MAG: OmpA family protein, partial [Desulfobacula sp.]|nr:OmpA family protein [Desulfobacula sp.]